MGSVITSSPGWSGVLDNLFSQPFKIILSTTDNVTLSGGEEAGTRDNQLRPIHDRNVPTYLNEGFDNRRNRDGPLLTPLPFTVFQYRDRFPDLLNASRLRRMRTDGNELRIRG